MTKNNNIDYYSHRLKYSQKSERFKSRLISGNDDDDDGFYYNDIGMICFCCDNYCNHTKDCAFKKEKTREKEEEKESLPLIWKYNNIEESLYYEKERLKTFIEWPFPDIASPVELAEDGFYYLRKDDLIECIFCSLKLSIFIDDNHFKISHNYHSPQCVLKHNSLNFTRKQSKILDSVKKLPLKEKEDIFDKKEPYHFSPIDSNIINRFSRFSFLTVIKRSKENKNYSQYASVKNRLQSFQSSPSRFSNHKNMPKQFADAGFYYTGLSDHVQCFYCGIIIRNWNYNSQCDILPKVAHIVLHPNCLYVKLHFQITYNITEDMQILIKKNFSPLPLPLYKISDIDLNILYDNNRLDIVNIPNSYSDNKDYYANLLKYILKKKFEESGLIYSNRASFLKDIENFEKNNEIIMNYKKYIDNEIQLDQDCNEDYDFIDIKTKRKCILCNNLVKICFLPCKHTIICARCVLITKYERCLLCSTKITDLVGIFYNRCKYCLKKEGIFCFLPCRCSNVCRKCAFMRFENNKYPIKCPSCQLESNKNFELCFKQ